MAIDQRLRLVSCVIPDACNKPSLKKSGQPKTNIFEMQALNEICVQKGNSSGMCSYEIYVNNVFLTIL